MSRAKPVTIASSYAFHLIVLTINLRVENVELILRGKQE